METRNKRLRNMRNQRRANISCERQPIYPMVWVVDGASEELLRWWNGVSQSLHFRYAPNCAGFMGDRGHGLLAHCVSECNAISVVIES